MSAVVTLRPFTASDVDRVMTEFSTEDAVGSVQWFGFLPGSAAAHREFAETGFMTADWGRVIIEASGEWAGRLAWWKNKWGPPESWCWQFGILLRADMRGQGIGTQAQRMLVEYLLAHTRTNRIEAVTDVTNIAEQKALERAGFTREGILRSCQWRNGEWHDQIMYSVIRSDFGHVPARET